MAEVLDLTYDKVEALDPPYYKGSYGGSTRYYLWQDGGARPNQLKRVKVAEVLNLTYDKVEALDPTSYNGSYPLWLDWGARPNL